MQPSLNFQKIIPSTEAVTFKYTTITVFPHPPLFSQRFKAQTHTRADGHHVIQPRQRLRHWLITRASTIPSAPLPLHHGAGQR